MLNCTQDENDGKFSASKVAIYARFFHCLYNGENRNVSLLLIANSYSINWGQGKHMEGKSTYSNGFHERD